MPAAEDSHGSCSKPSGIPARADDRHERLSVLVSAQGTVLPFDAPIVVGDDTHFREVLDYDGDGAPDAISARFVLATGAVVMKGYRTASGILTEDWSLSFTGAVTPGPEPKSAIVRGDFNADGLDDFGFAIGPWVGIWHSNGAGVPPSIAYGFLEPDSIDQVLVADFDGDGLPDLAFREVIQMHFGESWT